MHIYNSPLASLDSPAVVALGCFDGVHIGHAAVIRTAKEKAVSLGLPLAVFTFEEPPRNFFSPRAVPMICTVSDKLAHLEALGVDIAVCVPLSEQIFKTTAEDFVRHILLSRLKAACVVCGYNYRVGKHALGDPKLISQICREADVSAFVVDETKYENMPVSSSRIRAAIADGDVQLARALLGRPYSLTSRVVDGQHLARRLGFPTVNTLPDERLVTPRNGVYLTIVTVDGKAYRGVTNTGVRPTVNTRFPCVETHLLGFDGNLYGMTVKTEFMKFIRDEKKFGSVEDLATQVKKDIQTASDMEI